MRFSAVPEVLFQNANLSWSEVSRLVNFALEIATLLHIWQSHPHGSAGNPFIGGFQKISVDRFCRKILSQIMNLFVHFFSLASVSLASLRAFAILD